MGMDLDFPIQKTNFETMFGISTLQSTFCSSERAPKIVFAIVMVSHISFFGYKMGTKNSNT